MAFAGLGKSQIRKPCSTVTQYEVFYFATELCENGKLFDYIITDIHSMMHQEGRMKSSLARALFTGILEAVQFLH